MTAIIDYGVGNLFSLVCSLEKIGEEAQITAAAGNGNVMGCQFHPEKSGEVGLNILRAFIEMKEGAIC